MPIFKSHGSGKYKKKQLGHLGENVILEEEVLIFHPENVEIGDNVYIGHRTILKGYFKNKLIIGSGSWIGQSVMIHSAGGVHIGKNVGIAPLVCIFSSQHSIDQAKKDNITDNKILFKEVIIEDGCDIGWCATILPGVKIGKGSVVGAGAVVSRDVKPFSVVAGVPARELRKRR